MRRAVLIPAGTVPGVATIAPSIVWA